MADKKWVRNHALKTAVGVLVTAGVTALLAWLVPPVKRLLGSTLDLIIDLLQWFGQPVEVARWHYWLLALVCVGVAIVLLRAILARMRSSIPTYTSYTIDTFFEIVWRWNYPPFGGVGEPQPYCPQCDRAMIYYYASYSPTCGVVCEHCKLKREFDGSPEDLTQRVRREIDVNLRNNRWIASVNNEGKPKS